MKKWYSLNIILLLGVQFTFAQIQDDSLSYFLEGVDVVADDSAYLRKYSRTKYFVKEIYVYSVLAADMFNEVEDTLKLIDSKKQKKKYIKKAYKELKKEFGYEISQMTITRGHFLMKILHKETGMTAYEIVEKYRGKVKAKSWEAVLKLNNTTLKKYYSPEIEDVVLDRVLKEIEAGKIIPKPRPPVTERGKKAARKRKRAQRKKLKAKKKLLRKKKRNKT
ncbi:MAG: DUF4294 domain-containing protein [Flavobacteriales bacterium]|jgi:hypothetical protein|nr:DUF4294 domain-containing protein [Flavobacteriales bacterium]